MSTANEFSRFVRDLATSLRVTKILYLGCYSIEDLSEFPLDAKVSGITQDPKILERMVERYPSFEFRQGDPLATSYDENRF